MPFDPNDYGREVATILALVDGGHRLMPLVVGAPLSRNSAQRDRHEVDPGGPSGLQSDASALQAGIEALGGRRADDLFADSPHPKAALAGLWTYFSCFEEAHAIAQDDPSSEGSYWHAILHRQEPDDFNAGYWIRRIDRPHPTERRLAQAAAAIASRQETRFAGIDPTGTRWDPHAFIEVCAQARQNPGSAAARFALEVQRAEWQILFDYCARRTPAADVSKER